MLISSDTGGGQIVSPSEDTRFYDDLACLAADWDDHAPDRRAYVRVAGGRWVDARDASYVQMAANQTPMGSGFVASATIADARAADRAARVLTFAELVRVARGTR